MSVNELIRCGVSNYLEFQNVGENFFYAADSAATAGAGSKKFVKIPFSKSEVFSNTFLSFKEKRQLVKVIESCLAGYDKISKQEITRAKINSTHIYDKEIELSAEEQGRLYDSKDKPIREFLLEMGIEKRMQDILLYAIGNINENQFDPSMIKLERISTFDFFKRIQKYMRSIGYYGASPFLLSNYGSSEYAQALSRYAYTHPFICLHVMNFRIGSLHTNIYIVNPELKVKNVHFEKNTEGKIAFKSVDMSFSKAVRFDKDYFNFIVFCV